MYTYFIHSVCRLFLKLLMPVVRLLETHNGSVKVESVVWIPAGDSGFFGGKNPTDVDITVPIVFEGFRDIGNVIKKDGK